MKRPAPRSEPWYDADDAEGPSCRRCSAQKLRWPTRKGQVYCLDCWKDYGSEAADAISLCDLERSTTWRVFRTPPASGSLGRSYALQIEVTPEDSFDAARRLLREAADASGPQALPPIVLNMANAEWVGGGFLTDASGQEEELCRKSDLFPQLMRAYRAGGFPIPELGSIVLPDVLVLRSREGKAYKLLEEPFRVAIITAAAPLKPDTSTAEGLEAYIKLMSQKVDALLAVVEHLGYAEVVLSAWGCGAFRNPPEEVARIFRAALQGRFSGSFRKVLFAIFDRPDWRESNCSIFKRELCG